MEAIREALGVEKWVLFGGSWGATLSLVYAQTYPERVKGLIVHGVNLYRKEELGWFYQEGASRIFPDYWERSEERRVGKDGRARWKPGGNCKRRGRSRRR